MEREKIRTSRVGTLRNNGFTLIELTVVIVLISLMLLISVPRVRDTILSDDLKSTVNHLSNNAHELRYESVRNHIDYILHIDLNDNRVWTYRADSTPEAKSEARKGAWHLPKGIKFTDIYRFDSQKISDGEVTIRFFKKGYVQPTVVHIAREERSFTLIFHPFLSAIETHDKYMDYRYAGY